MQRKRRPLSVEKKQSRAAYCFLIPYIIGLCYFFIYPLIQTIYYSLCDVSVVSGGMTYKFKAFENYKYMLFTDANFLKSVGSSLSSLLVTVPIILIFSIFVAILLNQKFKGRMLMRGLFFLPVIIASGVVMKIITGDVFASDTLDGTAQIFQSGVLEEILSRSGLPEGLVTTVCSASSSVFDLSWKSGIQIILFISALQGVPASYYEAASIEGAGAWETFWKITFPVLSPTSLLVVIYTMIDSFTNISNRVMEAILQRFDNIQYGLASASAIIYFLVIIVILGVIFGLISKRVFYNQ